MFNVIYKITQPQILLDIFGQGLLTIKYFWDSAQVISVTRVQEKQENRALSAYYLSWFLPVSVQLYMHGCRFGVLCQSWLSSAKYNPSSFYSVLSLMKDAIAPKEDPPPSLMNVISYGACTRWAILCPFIPRVRSWTKLWDFVRPCRLGMIAPWRHW